MASWIEIATFVEKRNTGKSRLMWPRGLKYSIDNCVITYYVEAYVASWIEISVLPPSDLGTKSRLMWPRGLK